MGEAAASLFLVVDDDPRSCRLNSLLDLLTAR